MNTTILDVLNKEIFRRGVLKNSDTFLPVGTEVIYEPELCCSMFSEDCVTPEKHLKLDYVRFVYGPFYKYPLFHHLKMNFTSEISISRFECLNMSDEEKRIFRKKEFRNLNFKCREEGERIVRKVNTANPIHPIKNQLANLISNLLQYIARDLPINIFAESCLRCFFAGGIPCGWLGDFSTGAIVCYWPHEDEPTFSDDIDLPWHKHMSMREGDYPYAFPQKIVNE